MDDKEEEREERRSKTLNFIQAPAEFKLIEEYSIISFGGVCHSQCVPVCACVLLFVVLQLINPLSHIEI